MNRFLAFLLLALGATPVSAFVVSPSSSIPQTTTARQRHHATPLYAQKQRRTFLRRVKNVAFAAIGLRTATQPASAAPSSAATMADDAVNGRIVTFEVTNLGGEEGRTGKFQIQMAPEWAPKGVARFEVRSYRVDANSIHKEYLNIDVSVSLSYRNLQTLVSGRIVASFVYCQVSLSNLVSMAIPRSRKSGGRPTFPTTP